MVDVITEIVIDRPIDQIAGYAADPSKDLATLKRLLEAR